MDTATAHPDVIRAMSWLTGYSNALAGDAHLPPAPWMDADAFGRGQAVVIEREFAEAEAIIEASHHG